MVAMARRKDESLLVHGLAVLAECTPATVVRALHGEANDYTNAKVGALYRTLVKGEQDDGLEREWALALDRVRAQARRMNQRARERQNGASGSDRSSGGG